MSGSLPRFLASRAHLCRQPLTTEVDVCQRQCSECRCCVLVQATIAHLAKSPYVTLQRPLGWTLIIKSLRCVCRNLTVCCGSGAGPRCRRWLRAPQESPRSWPGSSFAGDGLRRCPRARRRQSERPARMDLRVMSLSDAFEWSQCSRALLKFRRRRAITVPSNGFASLGHRAWPMPSNSTSSIRAPDVCSKERPLAGNAMVSSRPFTITRPPRKLKQNPLFMPIYRHCRLAPVASEATRQGNEPAI